MNNILIPIIFYLVIGAILLLSYTKNKAKTQKSLKLSIKYGKSMLPLFIVIIIALGMLQGVFNEEFINKYFFIFNGFWGVFGAALMGSIVHIPAFVAFPIGGHILHSGVNAGVIAVLINTLIMVHTFTIPLEIKYMGTKFALVRNGLSLVSAIIIGVIIGVVY